MCMPERWLCYRSHADVSRGLAAHVFNNWKALPCLNIGLSCLEAEQDLFIDVTSRSRLNSPLIELESN